MDFEDSPGELAAFRDEVRTFLDAHAELKRGDEARLVAQRRRDRPGAGGGLPGAVPAAWQRLLYDTGWAGLTWPTKFGGRGLSAAYQIVWGQELARYDTTAGFITAAQALVGPTLMQHGTPEQQQRYLGPLLSRRGVLVSAVPPGLRRRLGPRRACEPRRPCLRAVTSGS